MSFQNDIICESCDKIYANIDYKWCRQCVINNLEKNFTNWTSGNEKIDNFIQIMQLKIKGYHDIIVEWIPYNQFNNVKKTNEDGLTTAIWKDGLLKYDEKERKHKRISNMEVSLKCLNNSQNVINEFSNEVETYQYSIDHIPEIYGISQHPDTKNYIIVFESNYCNECGEIYANIDYKWCKQCIINNFKKNFMNWTSGNEKIDNFIQIMQLKIKRYNVIVEWIPYNQFNNVKKPNEDGLAIAIWKDGLLIYDEKERKHKRIPNIGVSLKCLNNLQNVINEFSNEVKAHQYSIVSKGHIPEIFGISQHPDTKNYIIVFESNYCNECGEIYTEIGYKWCIQCQINNLKQNFTNWTSGNEKIDDFIQEMQLKIEKYDDIVEWIPYNQFKNVKKIGKDGFATAIWKNGSLKFNYEEINYKRKPNEEVTLKCLNDSQNVISDLLNEVKAYFINLNPIVYGISQNPDTKNYIIVLNNSYCKECGEIYTEIDLKWCKQCQINNLKQNFSNWISGNEKIDDFIQEMQLKIEKYDDII
ncbi:hypothetical protein C1646_751240, partial [Rhizophagus diaphanus]